MICLEVSKVRARTLLELPATKEQSVEKIVGFLTSTTLTNNNVYDGVHYTLFYGVRTVNVVLLCCITYEITSYSQQNNSCIKFICVTDSKRRYSVTVAVYSSTPCICNSNLELLIASCKRNGRLFI